MIYVIIEALIICMIFSIVVIQGVKKNPLSGLHNLPIKIQERVSVLQEYTYQDIKVMDTKERIIKKLPALLILLLLFLFMMYWNGARTFLDGFLYTLVLWTIIKVFVSCVLYCLWYAHSPQYWIKGTEDLKDEYQNYWFYLKSIPRSLCAGVVVSLIVGIVMMFIGG